MERGRQVEGPEADTGEEQGLSVLKRMSAEVTVLLFFNTTNFKLSFNPVPRMLF